MSSLDLTHIKRPVLLAHAVTRVTQNAQHLWGAKYLYIYLDGLLET